MIVKLSVADPHDLATAYPNVKSYLNRIPDSAWKDFLRGIAEQVNANLFSEEALPAAQAMSAPPALGANLIADSEVTSAANYALASGAVYDGTVSRGLGGSLNLSADGASAQSVLVSVSPNTKYTLSAYVRADSPVAMAQTLLSRYSAANAFLRNAGGSRWLPSKPKAWEEIVTPFLTAADEFKVRAKIFRATESGAGDLWADDWRISEGWGAVEDPEQKTEFSGQSTRIDYLGNYTICRNGVWESFFPFGVFQNNANDFSVYSNQGFNLIMSNQGSDTLANRAAAAISGYNPSGMMAMIELARYFIVGDAAYGDAATLDASIATADHPAVLAYYLDNEQYDQYALITAFLARLKATDPNHPVFSLFGNEGLARAYRYFIDSIGDYSWRENGAGVLVQQYAQGQTIPQGLSIISLDTTTTAGQLRFEVYRSLIHGAKGVALYKDPIFNTSTAISTLAFWSEIPTLRTEIDALLPLLRRPHWTDWTAAVSNPDIVSGTRDYQGEGVVLLANSKNAQAAFNVTLSGMGYAPSTAVNMLTQEETSVSGGVVAVTLPAYGTAVLRLAA